MRKIFAHFPGHEGEGAVSIFGILSSGAFSFAYRASSGRSIEYEMRKWI